MNSAYGIIINQLTGWSAASDVYVANIISIEYPAICVHKRFDVLQDTPLSCRQVRYGKALLAHHFAFILYL